MEEQRNRTSYKKSVEMFNVDRLSNSLISYRIDNKLSELDMANKLGFSLNKYLDLEKGKITLTDVLRMNSRLNLNISIFINKEQIL